jgi:hypothetical protein
VAGTYWRRTALGLFAQQPSPSPPVPPQEERKPIIWASQWEKEQAAKRKGKQ